MSSSETFGHCTTELPCFTETLSFAHAKHPRVNRLLTKQDFVIHAVKRRKVNLQLKELNGCENAIPNSIGNKEDPFLETVSTHCHQGCLTTFIDATGNEWHTQNGSLHCVCGKVFHAWHGPDHCCWTHTKWDANTFSFTFCACPDRGDVASYLTRLFQFRPGWPSFYFTCKVYFLQLQKKKTLVQSLANGLWVSNVPLILRILALPGWILIVRHFLVTYIITLYLKKKGTFMVKHWLALQMFILSILFKVRIRIFLKRPLQVRFPLTKATSSNQSFLLKARSFQSGNYYATTPFSYEHLFCISTKLVWSALSCRSLFLKKTQCRVHILEKGSCITMGINQKL